MWNTESKEETFRLGHGKRRRTEETPDGTPESPPLTLPDRHDPVHTQLSSDGCNSAKGRVTRIRETKRVPLPSPTSLETRPVGRLTGGQRYHGPYAFAVVDGDVGAVPGWKDGPLSRQSGPTSGRRSRPRAEGAWPYRTSLQKT